MSQSSKKQTNNSSEAVLRGSFVDETKTIGVSGFILAKVGHRITLQIQTTNVTDDTELYSYYDGTNLLLQIRIIYTSGAREVISSVERVA
ncbi:MAG: hypothetical protein ABIM30_01145 [candidate division WOR-3 bacterium]